MPIKHKKKTHTTMQNAIEFIMSDFLLSLLIGISITLSITSSLIIIYKLLFCNPEGMSFRQYFNYQYDSEERLKKKMDLDKEEINRVVKSYIKVLFLNLEDIIREELLKNEENEED